MKTSEQLWDEYVSAFDEFTKASLEFHSGVKDKLKFVRLGLRQERGAAFSIAQHLTVDELKLIVGELLEIAVYSNGYTLAARNLIFKIPREWLLEHTEDYMTPILARNDFEEHTGVLHIYEMLDPKLALELAKKDLGHQDEMLKEIGENFLRRLQQR